jgi:hypothetical protein
MQGVAEPPSAPPFALPAEVEAALIDPEYFRRSKELADMSDALRSSPYGSSPADPAKTRVLDLRGEVLEVKGGVLAVTSPSAEVGRGRVLDLRGGQLAVEGPTSGLERRILPY